MKKPKPSQRRAQARRQRDRAWRAARARERRTRGPLGPAGTVVRVTHVEAMPCGRHLAVYGERGQLLGILAIEDGP